MTALLKQRLRRPHRPCTPAAKLVFLVLAALTEFERDLIRERTQAGLAAARERGRVGGGPSVWTPEWSQAARAMVASGEGAASIARALGVSRASVYRLLGKPTEEPGRTRQVVLGSWGDGESDGRNKGTASYRTGNSVTELPTLLVTHIRVPSKVRPNGPSNP